MSKSNIERVRRKFNFWLHQAYSHQVLRPSFSEQELADGYYSQSGQDKWIVETLFPGKRSGVFVDIGAHDGITFSNTYFLEKELGWLGLVIEPIPAIFEKLAKNRTCTLIQGCISEQPGKQKFQVIEGYSEMLSGLVDAYDSRHRKRIESELTSYGGTRSEIEVTCYRLSHLLELHSITSVDYLNIDTEGSELRILRGIDWSNVDIKVISVENNYSDYRIPQLLKKHGYHFHSIVGHDEFYVHQS